MNKLQGSLEINGLQKVVDVGEAESVQLKKKIHLRHLELNFGKVGEQGCEDERRMENDALVMNAL